MSSQDQDLLKIKNQLEEIVDAIKNETFVLPLGWSSCALKKFLKTCDKGYILNVLKTITVYLSSYRYTGVSMDFRTCISRWRRTIITCLPKNLFDDEAYCIKLLNLGCTPKDIPPNNITRKIVIEALRQGFSSYLDYIPQDIRGPDLYLDAVKNGFNIFRVPLRFRSYDVCLEAVKISGIAFTYVPSSCVDYKLCLEAVKSDHRAIELMSYEHIDDKIKWYAGNCELYPRKLWASCVIRRHVLRYLLNPKPGRTGALIKKEIRQAIEEW